MAKRKTGNKGMIFGSVVGAIAGAAYALYKTPMSGRELRGKMSPGSMTSVRRTDTSSGGGLTSKVMHVVEHTLAPMVGVQLGKTANGPSRNGSVKMSEPIAVATPTNGSASASTSDTISSQRFAWGSPTPEASDKDTVPSAPETATVAANLPESAPEFETGPEFEAADNTKSPTDPDLEAEDTDESTSASVQNWNTGTIRSKRFAWGEAAPDAMVSTAATDASPIASIDNDELTDVPATEDALAGNEPGSPSNVDSTVLVSASAASTGKMNPFPKLGGLENN